MPNTIDLCLTVEMYNVLSARLSARLYKMSARLFARLTDWTSRNSSVNNSGGQCLCTRSFSLLVISFPPTFLCFRCGIISIGYFCWYWNSNWNSRMMQFTDRKNNWKRKKKFSYFSSLLFGLPVFLPFLLLTVRLAVDGWDIIRRERKELNKKLTTVWW